MEPPHNPGRFSVGLSTRYNLVNAGKLTRVKVGGKSFVTEESVNRLIDQQIAAGKAESK